MQRFVEQEKNYNFLVEFRRHPQSMYNAERRTGLLVSFWLG